MWQGMTKKKSLLQNKTLLMHRDIWHSHFSHVILMVKMQTHMGPFINISHTDDSPTGLECKSNKWKQSCVAICGIFLHQKSDTSALRMFISLFLFLSVKWYLTVSKTKKTCSSKFTAVSICSWLKLKDGASLCWISKGYQQICFHPTDKHIFNIGFWNAAKLTTFKLGFHQLSCGPSISFQERRSFRKRLILARLLLFVSASKR